MGSELILNNKNGKTFNLMYDDDTGDLNMTVTELKALTTTYKKEDIADMLLLKDIKNGSICFIESLNQWYTYVGTDLSDGVNYINGWEKQGFKDIEVTKDYNVTRNKEILHIDTINKSITITLDNHLNVNDVVTITDIGNNFKTNNVLVRDVNGKKIDGYDFIVLDKNNTTITMSLGNNGWVTDNKDVASIHIPEIYVNGALGNDRDGKRYLLNKSTITEYEKQKLYYETIKKLIFDNKKEITTVVGTNDVYYVDLENGSDDNDGLGENTAFKTAKYALSIYNRYDKGDVILFKRGDTHTLVDTIGDTLNLNSQLSGCSLGSYGDNSLPLPVLTTYNVIGGTWIQVESDETTESTDSNIWINDVVLNDTHRLFENDVELRYSYDKTLEPLSDVYRWYVNDNNNIVLFSKTNPNDKVYSKTFSTNTLEFKDMSDINIFDLNITDVYLSNCINILFSNCELGNKSINGCTVENSKDIVILNTICDSKWLIDNNMALSLSDTYPNGSIYRGANVGIDFKYGNENCSVVNSYFNNWGIAGVNTDMLGDSTNKNITLKDLYIESTDTSYGTGINNIGIDSLVKNCYIKNVKSFNKLYGNNNKYENILIDGVSKSNLTSKDEANGLNFDTNLGVVNNTYEDIIIKDTDSTGISMLGNTSTIKDNKFINISVYDFSLDNLTLIAGIAINNFNNIFIGNNVFKDGVAKPYYIEGVGNLLDNEFNEYDNIGGNTSIDKITVSNVVSKFGNGCLFNGTNQSVSLADIRPLNNNVLSILFKYTLVSSTTNTEVLSLSGVNLTIKYTGALVINFNGKDYTLITPELNIEYDVDVKYINNILTVKINNELQLEVLVDNILLNTNTYKICGNNSFSNMIIRDLFVINKYVNNSDLNIYRNDVESFFNHCKNSDNIVNEYLSFTKDDCIINAPMFDNTSYIRNYANSVNSDIENYTTDCNITGLNTGLQKIAFNKDIVFNSKMNFNDNNKVNLKHITDLPYTIIVVINNTIYSIREDNNIPVYKTVGGLESNCNSMINKDVVLNNKNLTDILEEVTVEDKAIIINKVLTDKEIIDLVNNADKLSNVSNGTNYIEW